MPSKVTLRLGKVLGDGRVGAVFEVYIVGDDDLKHDLPPLVAKIASPNRNKSLAREAWFYDEMACLQGVAIPHCWGWFVGEVADEVDMTVWERIGVEEEDCDEDDERVFEHLGQCRLGAFDHATFRELCGEGDFSLLLLERTSNETLPEDVHDIPDSVRYVT